MTTIHIHTIYKQQTIFLLLSGNPFVATSFTAAFETFAPCSTCQSHRWAYICMLCMLSCLTYKRSRNTDIGEREREDIAKAIDH